MRLKQLYDDKCDEHGFLSLSSFLMLCLERNMVTNRFGIDVFYQAYKEAAGTSPVLDNKRFFYAIILIAQNLYRRSSSPIQQLFSEMLVDSNLGEDKTMSSG